jgi:hypothetical protein
MFQRVDYRGAEVNKAADLPVVVHPIHPIEPGQVLIVSGLSDNAGALGGEHTIDDSSLHAHALLAESYGGGAAPGEGLFLTTWLLNVLSRIGEVDLDPNAQVRLTCPPSVAAKMIVLDVFAVASGMKAAPAGAMDFSGSGKDINVTLTVPTGAPRLWLMHLGFEGPTKEWLIEEDPSWGGIIPYHGGTSGGSPRSNVTGGMYWRIAETDGVSYVGKLSADMDWTLHLVALDEVLA